MTTPLSLTLAPPYKIKSCRDGLFLYNENDYYIGKALDLYGEYGQEEADIFKQLVHPYQTVLDIGANIGAHTVFFAKQVGPTGTVYAFEPQRIVYQQLVANVALNSLFNVKALHAGLGAEKGNIFVPPVDYFHVGNFGGIEMQTQFAQGEKVDLLCIDDLELGACHFIKVDVEGMEQQVLSGAVATIKRFKPLLYVENDRENKSADLIRFIAELGYDMYWHLPLLYSANNFFNNTENIYGRMASINMLCIPKEIPVKIDLRKVTGPDDDWRKK